MKNLAIVLSAFFLVLSLFISSCDGDEKSIPGNTLRYNGKNYKLARPTGLKFGSFEAAGVTYNNTDFIFFDRVVDVQDPDPVYIHGFYVEMYSAGSVDFRGGTFTYFDGFGSPPAGNLFTAAELFFYDDDEDPVEVDGGTITLTISGDTYTFKFSLTTENEKKIEGNYSGAVELLNLGEPNISGSVSVDADSRSADFGEIEDYGSSGTHYNYDFTIYDEDETYELYFEAFSLGTSAFQAGTFNYGTAGTSYFDIINFIDYETLTFYQAISGSVVVTKLSGSYEYRLQFNVGLDDGSTLTGTVEGNFRYFGMGGRMGRVRHELSRERLGTSSSRFIVKRSTLKRLRK